MNLRKTAIEIHEKGLQFSESAVAELDVLEAAIQEIVQRTVKAFIHENLEDAEKIEPLEQVVDELVREMKARHIARLQNGECTIEPVSYTHLADGDAFVGGASRRQYCRMALCSEKGRH